MTHSLGRGSKPPQDTGKNEPLVWNLRPVRGRLPANDEISVALNTLFGINTPADIEAIIEWKYIHIDDSQETSKRVAFLTCYPPWEVEHGREIAICNGVPTGIGPIELDEYGYVDD
jgi:hypothetical protein